MQCRADAQGVHIKKLGQGRDRSKPASVNDLEDTFRQSSACIHLVEEVGALQLIAAELQLRQWAVLPDGQGCIQNVLAYQALERRPQTEGLANLLQCSIVGQ